MDSTAYTLLLAMSAAVCAAFISGWLLHMMVPAGLFWIVMLVNLVFTPIGLFLPWYCPRQRERPVVPTGNILLAAVTSIIACCSILLINRVSISKVPAQKILTEEFVRTLIAVCGIAIATSLVFFLLHYSLIQEASELRRAGRKIRRMLWKAPKAKLQLCDDLEATCPGECAICLEALANLEVELACLPEDPRKVKPFHGLLRFPCQHTFHSTCADRWMAQEVSCPMCRQHMGSLSKCVRICLRHEAAAAHEAARLEEGRQSAASERVDAAKLEEAEDLEGELEEGIVQEKDGQDAAEGGVLLGVAVEVPDAANGGRGAQPDDSSWSTSSASAEATCKATLGSSLAPAVGPTESASGVVAMSAVAPTRQPRPPANDEDQAGIELPQNADELKLVSI